MVYNITMIIFYATDYDRNIPTSTYVDMTMDILGIKHQFGYEDSIPVLVGSDKHISISHSHNVIAIAVDDVAIGVDVERMSDRKYQLIAERVLKRSVNTLKEFYHAWTVYEAIFKSRLSTPHTMTNDELLPGFCIAVASDREIISTQYIRIYRR